MSEERKEVILFWNTVRTNEIFSRSISHYDWHDLSPDARKDVVEVYKAAKNIAELVS